LEDDAARVKKPYIPLPLTKRGGISLYTNLVLSYSYEWYNREMDERALEKILKALANKRRILMLKILKKRKKISMGDTSNEIKLSFRSTSKHFSILYNAGIVEREQVSLTMYYSISTKPPQAAKLILGII